MSTVERHTRTEVEKRARECYRLRYEITPAYTQEKWVEHCHEIYGDRSEQTYCSYWAKAKDMYDKSWKERLNNMLGPATDELFNLLSSEDQKIRQRAIDQIMKYTGNDVTKIDANVKGNLDIKIGFGG
jgi:oligoendopeptidase F